MKPVGKDSSLKTWKGDQWKIGGGTTWGWYSVRQGAQR
jgi:glucose dehydrogenase